MNAIKRTRYNNIQVSYYLNGLRVLTALGKDGYYRKFRYCSNTKIKDALKHFRTEYKNQL